MAESLNDKLRVVQILTVALAMGPIMFGVVVLFLPPTGMAAPVHGMPLLTIAGIAFGVMLQVVRYFATAIVTNSELRRLAATARSEADLDALLDLHRRLMIVRAAMFEGAAFFLIIAYMLERTPLALAGAVFMIVGILAGFPSEARVAAWLEEKLKAMAALRPHPPAPSPTRGQGEK